jgi:lipoate-protein ligase A
MVEGMSFEQAYASMDEWTIEALATLGIRAWYQPLNDITSSIGKIAGAAQARRGSAVLHHVTMAYDIDAVKMHEVLRVGREKLSDKGTTSAQKRVDPLRSQTGLAREAVIERMVDTFRSRHGGLAHASLGAEELARAQALVERRFSTPAWTALLP